MASAALDIYTEGPLNTTVYLCALQVKLVGSLTVILGRCSSQLSILGVP